MTTLCQLNDNIASYKRVPSADLCALCADDFPKQSNFIVFSTVKAFKVELIGKVNEGYSRLEWVIFTALIGGGLLIGSFLNVVIHRGPRIWGLVTDENRIGNIAHPRSYCPSCRTPLNPKNLIPIVSYVAQHGRCTFCRAKINPRYWLVEALGAVSVGLAIWAFNLSGTAMVAAIFGWFLIALAAIDFETGYLPDALTFPLIAGGLCVNVVGTLVPLTDSVFGAVLGYSVFRLIGYFFQRLRGREGLGQGDAKLIAAAGAWLGWQSLPSVILIGSVSTLVAVVAKSGLKQPASDLEIPFGPGLCLGAATVLYLGIPTIGL